MLLIISSSDSTNQNSSSFSYFEDNLGSEVKELLTLSYISFSSSSLSLLSWESSVTSFLFNSFLLVVDLYDCLLFIFCPLTRLVDRLRLLKSWVSDFTLFLNKCFDSSSTSLAVLFYSNFLHFEKSEFYFLNYISMVLIIRHSNYKNQTHW